MRPEKTCEMCGSRWTPRNATQARRNRTCGRPECRWLVNRRRTSLAERFWAKVNRADPSHCWEWTGNRYRDGYGCIRGDAPDSTKQRTHRVSWEIHFGPIPEGMMVCHRCDNPPCVNPAHLFVGTVTDNNRDTVSKGRHFTPKRDHRSSASIELRVPAISPNRPAAKAVRAR